MAPTSEAPTNGGRSPSSLKPLHFGCIATQLSLQHNTQQDLHLRKLNSHQLLLPTDPSAFQADRTRSNFELGTESPGSTKNSELRTKNYQALELGASSPASSDTAAHPAIPCW